MDVDGWMSFTMAMKAIFQQVNHQSAKRVLGFVWFLQSHKAFKVLHMLCFHFMMHNLGLWTMQPYASITELLQLLCVVSMLPLFACTLTKNSYVPVRLPVWLRPQCLLQRWRPPSRSLQSMETLRPQERRWMARTLQKCARTASSSMARMSPLQMST